MWRRLFLVHFDRVVQRIVINSDCVPVLFLLLVYYVHVEFFAKALVKVRARYILSVVIDLVYALWALLFGDLLLFLTG